MPSMGCFSFFPFGGFDLTHDGLAGRFNERFAGFFKNGTTPKHVLERCRTWIGDLATYYKKLDSKLDDPKIDEVFRLLSQSGDIILKNRLYRCAGTNTYQTELGRTVVTGLFDPTITHNAPTTISGLAVQSGTAGKTAAWWNESDYKIIDANHALITPNQLKKFSQQQAQQIMYFSWPVNAGRVFRRANIQ